jgi:hypothetical protein
MVRSSEKESSVRNRMLLYPTHPFGDQRLLLGCQSPQVFQDNARRVKVRERRDSTRHLPNRQAF